MKTPTGTFFPSFVTDDMDLSLRDAIVYNYIWEQTFAGIDWLYSSIKELSVATNLSERSVYRAIEQLKSKNFLYMEKTNMASHHLFRVFMPKSFMREVPYLLDELLDSLDTETLAYENIKLIKDWVTINPHYAGHKLHDKSSDGGLYSPFIEMLEIYPEVAAEEITNIGKLPLNKPYAENLELPKRYKIEHILCRNEQFFDRTVKRNMPEITGNTTKIAENILTDRSKNYSFLYGFGISSLHDCGRNNIFEYIFDQSVNDTETPVNTAFGPFGRGLKTKKIRYFLLSYASYIYYINYVYTKYYSNKYITRIYRKNFAAHYEHNNAAKIKNAKSNPPRAEEIVEHDNVDSAKVSNAKQTEEEPVIQKPKKQPVKRKTQKEVRENKLREALTLQLPNFDFSEDVEDALSDYVESLIEGDRIITPTALKLQLENLAKEDKAHHLEMVVLTTTSSWKDLHWGIKNVKDKLPSSDAYKYDKDGKIKNMYVGKTSTLTEREKELIRQQEESGEGVF